MAKKTISNYPNRVKLLISISLIILAILGLIFIFSGCALIPTKAERQAQQVQQSFEEYAKWYRTLNRTDSTLEIDIKFKLYAFQGFMGFDDHGFIVITDLRVTDAGYYIIPPHVLGHELLHLIDMAMTAHCLFYVNPDDLVKEGKGVL